MDLGGWLRSLGLEQYEAEFRKNEINERVLPSLTQEDLKEIGVGPVGHRRLLLEAIAALRDEMGAAKPPPADAWRLSPVPRASLPKTAPSAAKSPWCSPTLSARRRSPPAWTRKTCVRSSRHIRSVSPKLCVVSTDLLPSTWATVCWFILATHKHEPDGQNPRDPEQGDTERRKRQGSDSGPAK